MARPAQAGCVAAGQQGAQPARARPFEPVGPAPAGAPRLLHIRAPGFGTVQLTAGADQDPMLRLEIGRGRFSTEWLLDTRRMAVTVGNALGRVSRAFQRLVEQRIGLSPLRKT